MAKLTMTSSRWDELTALLNDEHRFHAEYPKVADYVDVAAGLDGTGDEQADAQFDLRLVHYMTGDSSLSTNPYWDIVESSVFERNGRRLVDNGNPEGSTRLSFAQILLQESYAYAIPSPSTIEWMKGFCRETPVVEFGAGRGYWAFQLSNAGLNVESYDAEPPDKTRNVSFPPATGRPNIWHRVGDLPDFSARVQVADFVLFLCWPPGWGDAMASEALTAFEAAGGKRLVYVGEPQGGKTGNDAFFDILTSRWTLDSVDPEFVSWWNSTDVAQGWVRH